MTATVWKDKRLVNTLSTLSSPEEVHEANRRVGTEVFEVPQPSSVYLYNKYMGGVDSHDQLRMNFDVGRNGKKWWRYLFWFLLNCSVVNAFDLYREYV